MKKLITTLTLMAVACASMAQVAVSREESGSGTPGAIGYENALKWDNDIFHAPQYMPGYPTAAIIYPRVVEVECVHAGSVVHCKGYNWLPELGRGEYLMIRPVMKANPHPTVVTNTIVKEVPVVREVIVEVPAKKKGE